MEEMRDEGKERKGKWERQENEEEHIFKPMLIKVSSQTKQAHKGKKFSSFLRAF